ncbi:MAG: transglutaminase domain-containing protein, partial [Eubacteriales bacterium]|nr:transglutaminase domain-containing protein [Eubacteriales bacterium]
HRAMDIAQQIHYDYPEYFWFTGDVSVNYQVLGNSYAGDLSFSYSCDPAAMAAGKKDLENASAEILSSLSGESEYEKVKGVYEYLINNSSYDINVKDQTSYSLLVNRSGVCAGYAGAMKYLLDRLNVDCMIASGKSKGEDHVWNLVRIGGCWYQVDPTWGDPVTGSDFQTISYDYLLLDDEEMFLDHQYDSGVVYPNCSTEESNFYRREGLYLESCDYTELSGMMKSCIENGRDFIFKCADTNLYFEVCNYLFEREQIFSLLRDFGYDIDSINYSTDEMHRTIKIVLAR